MIAETRRLWFRKATILLEDEALPAQRELEARYDAVVVISQKKLALSGWTLKEKVTTVVDLAGPAEAILARMSEREKIAKTYKDPRLAFLQNDRRVDELYQLYASFEYDQGRVPRPQTEFSAYRFFSASYDRQIISAISVSESFPRLRVHAIFSQRTTIEDKTVYRIIANSTRRIMWEICQWGHANGFVSLDLAFMNLEDPAKKGVTAFKMSFGGKTMPSYIYMYKSRGFTFFERFASVKLFLKNRVHRLRAAGWPS
jgi:hypothetical protein